MDMNFEGYQTLAMPLQEAWNFLANVENVVSCVPGYQGLDLLALLIMLVERTPEVLIFPAGLAALAISRLQGNISNSLLAYSLLCVLIFASRFLWHGVTPRQRWVSPAWFPALLGLGGQLLVIFAAIGGGGL